MWRNKQEVEVCASDCFLYFNHKRDLQKKTQNLFLNHVFCLFSKEPMCWSDFDFFLLTKQESYLTIFAHILCHAELLHAVLLNHLNVYFSKPIQWENPGPTCHKGKPFSSHTFLFFCFVLSFLLLCERASCRCCGLIKNSLGLCRGKRMCLRQHFYAIYNVQFVVLIEPSRPTEIAASALFYSLEVN